MKLPRETSPNINTRQSTKNHFNTTQICYAVESLQKNGVEQLKWKPKNGECDIPRSKNPR